MKLPDDIGFPDLDFPEWPKRAPCNPSPPAYPLYPPYPCKNPWGKKCKCDPDYKMITTTKTFTATKKDQKFVDHILYKLCQDYIKYYEQYQKNPKDLPTEAVLSYIYEELQEILK